MDGNKRYFTGRWIFTGRGIAENFAAVAENGVITAFGPAGEVPCPPGAERTELRGWVTPGLLDAHVHLICSDLHGEMTPRRAALTVCSGVSNAGKLLSAGVVACRDLGSVCGYALGVRDAVEERLVRGPKILAAGLSVCATGGHGGFISMECDGAEAVRRGVRTVIRDGADVVKLMVSGGVNSPGPEPGPCELTEAELAAAVEAAHDRGRKVAVHAHGATAIRRSVLAGVDSVEHGVFMTEDTMDEMAARGTFLVPTLSAPYYAVEEGLRLEPGNPDHLRSKSVIQRHRRVLKRCAEKGVKIAFGTDAGNTYDPYDRAFYELVLMTEAGLSPREAFCAATVGSAELMGLSDSLGEIAAGKRASFISWLDGNPLEDIQSVTGKKEIYLDGEKIC